MTRAQILLWVIAGAVFVALVVLALRGYVHPAMLIDLANVRICS